MGQVRLAKYDEAIVLEALHNCIAHQDYARHARVLVTEHPYRLVFESEGAFFEGRPEDYTVGDRTPRRYRNPTLAAGMVALNMIDTLGTGIGKMVRGQIRRHLPLPDHDASGPDSVRVTLHGRVLPIGGVKEKVLAAHRAGVTHVILPEGNREDAEDIPEHVLETVELHFAATVDDVINVAFA